MAATAARSARQGQGRLEEWRAGVKRGARRGWAMLSGGFLVALGVATLLALVSYRTTDPHSTPPRPGP